MLSPSDMVAVKIKQHIGNISNKKLSAVKLHTTEHLMFLQSFGQPYLEKKKYSWRRHLFKKKFCSRRNCQEGKEKGILQREERIQPILGKEKQTHTEMQEWALLDITLIRQELSYNM